MPVPAGRLYRAANMQFPEILAGFMIEVMPLIESSTGAAQELSKSDLSSPMPAARG
jgi:hypothetical protein